MSPGIAAAEKASKQLAVNSLLGTSRAARISPLQRNPDVGQVQSASAS
ncbi:MAG: hypothetical protein KA314_26510 [Chloroflexi bacterium]|nr:hypothetical protein [Chloroflexota bacterium]MBP8059403.1 hypothetical protein [Chloroflexota bacterium]